MAYQARIVIAFTLAFLPTLAGAAAATSGFCIEDRDDALWIDCERERSGITGREFVLCRRAPDKELIGSRAPKPILIEVTDSIARELAPGSGDCPALGGPPDPGPGKDGIPRNDGDAAADGGRVNSGAAPGAAADRRAGRQRPQTPETDHGR